MKKSVLTMAAAAALSLSSLATTAPAHAASSDIVSVSASARAADAQKLLDLINAHRAAKGLAPVKFSATLSGIAQGQSDRLVREEVIDHTDDFMTDPRAGSWDAVGEIHALSWQVSVDDLMNWWKGSTAHNKVLTDPRMEVVGIGLTYVDGSLAGDGSGWRLVGTVASYGYPAGAAPADTRTSVTTVTSGSGTAAGPFPDVPATHRFAADITWARDRGLLNGWSDGTFRPGQPIERAAMAAVMYRMAGSPHYTPPAASRFTDVRVGAPFYKEIHWARDRGLLNGWSDGSFRPKNPITRDATAALLYRYAGSPAYSAPRYSPFTDVPTWKKFYKEMAWLEATGLSEGWPDGTYRPYTTTNRDAMAAFLHRFDARF